MSEGITPRPRFGRVASAVFGLILVLIGIPMLVCPGPGIGSILVGSAMMWYGLTGRELRRKPQ